MDTEEPARQSGRARGRVAGIVTTLGGAAVAAAPFLTFYRFEAGQRSQELGGFHEALAGDSWADGWFFLGIGVGLVILGVLIASLRSGVATRLLGVLALMGAAFIVYAAVVDIMEEVPEEFAGQITLTPGLGLYVGLVGSVVSVIGSGMALFARARDPAPGAVPPPPPLPEEMPQSGPEEPPPPPERLPEEPPPPPKE